MSGVGGEKDILENLKGKCDELRKEVQEVLEETNKLLVSDQCESL